ncbi:MAG: aminotransferase IV [Flammeovirgaceae bacterium]|nr:aminotransferase IV [Flammeovirgaceae bacterium]|tara:strand:- start:7961 stop:8854 length:894 start_codon:yes stop_codon:yes gene_type:complete
MLQEYNSKNEKIFIHVNGELLPRDEAKVSVFDSIVQNGDGVWEGLRVYPEGIVCYDKHLTRLQEGAHALSYEGIPTKKEIKKAIKETLEANGMTDDTHIRLTLTRGEKVTSGMDARLNQSGCCLIVLAEWKKKVYDFSKGIRAISSSIRRSIPAFLDSKIHHNNMLSLVIAKIHANIAGYDAAVMLDDRGFVAELNDTNLFMVKEGVVYTPYANACLPGITRQTFIHLLEENKISILERDLSLVEFINADLVFATGTNGEITPVTEMDGREIKCDQKYLEELKDLFEAKLPSLCEPL